jgi:hypothetical protein
MDAEGNLGGTAGVLTEAQPVADHLFVACAAERNRKDGVDGPNGIDVPKCGLSEPATREPSAMR